jgi:hypothetical protein
MCYYMDMQKIQIYIYAFFIMLFLGVASVHASTEKNDGSSGVKTMHSEHPPHDHHEPNHIKKLDEAMRRKRKDEKIPTI